MNPVSMKTVALLCFTQNGAKIGERLKQRAEKRYSFSGFVSSRFIGESGLEKTDLSLSDWTREWFKKADCLVFVGACGIAVRAIAPFVRDKFTDPAVVVIDEQGKYCISLMSGHMGGANEFAQDFASQLDAQPIITTATDLNQKFAVDLFAKRNQLFLTDRSLAKEISAVLLAGQPVCFQSEFPFEGRLPEGLVSESGETNFKIQVGFSVPTQKNTLWLIPKNLVLGIGCRKGTEKQVIEQMVLHTLQSHSLPIESVSAAASIDLKAEELGLVSFCKEYGISFETYSAEQLSRVKGDFSSSEFVSKITGVDNVCERSAVKASKGRLLIPKQKGNGVTCAVAVNREQICLKF